jgi:PhzF family phenazine biosynthesis protein
VQGGSRPGAAVAGCRFNWAVLVERFAAFSDDPEGGNPAGLVRKGASLGAQEMQRIAAALGYSETAFVTGPIRRDTTIPVRYFAPEREVDFCGHATIAAAVAIGESEGYGAYTLSTRAGPVEITAHRDGARTVGTLRSPPTDCLPLDQHLTGQLLDALGWSAHDLDDALPPAIGYAGNKHPVLVVGNLRRLETLSYDFAALQRLCRAHEWITVHLVAATGPGTWRARDPFPWGGVIEDPATGAAAAAFAGYLRAHDQAAEGDTFVITQGVEMGRPSTITVELTDQAALVSGAATRIDPPRPV